MGGLRKMPAAGTIKPKLRIDIGQNIELSHHRVLGVENQYSGIEGQRYVRERSEAMQAKDSPFLIVDANGRLECNEIWGGTRNRDTEVAAGKVIGSIYSAASEGGRGGDIYYFGVCKGDAITRLAIADVTGHGESVAAISQYVYDAFSTHM